MAAEVPGEGATCRREIRELAVALGQRREVKLSAWLFVGEFLPGQFAQLIVDQRQELLGGVQVTLLDGGQDVRDIGHQQTQKGEGLRRTTSPTPDAGCGIVAASRLWTCQLLSTREEASAECTTGLVSSP
jgi:hypothetical protein